MRSLGVWTGAPRPSKPPISGFPPSRGAGRGQGGWVAVKEPTLTWRHCRRAILILHYALQIALSAGSAALADSHDAHPASVPIQFVGQPEAVVRAEAEIPVPPTSTGRFNGLRFLVSTSGSNDTCSATVLRMSE